MNLLVESKIIILDNHCGYLDVHMSLVARKSDFVYANKEGEDQQAPLPSLTCPVVVLLDKI